MANAIWSWDELVAACQGDADGTPSDAITGFSLDSRGLVSGEVFVALKDKRDGHEFVPDAFERGASAAVVSKTYKKGANDGALVRVNDPLAALTEVGVAARARLGDKARVVAVTGSVGKTSTKDMLLRAFARQGATHGAEKSYNNHWGVPLTLARMPSDTSFGVFEIGMNHAGEISPLTKIVKPHIAIITTVAEVHLANFKSLQDIARAKAEIFEGLSDDGVAVLNRDNDQFEFLSDLAEASGARVVSFGTHDEATYRLISAKSGLSGSHVTVSLNGVEAAYRIAAPGVHLQTNSLAVLAAVHEVGGSSEAAAKSFAEYQVAPGRGEHSYLPCGEGQLLLIDESYNANPASMRAAIDVFKLLESGVASRRIVVLGDMLELGGSADELHQSLAEPLAAANVDLVFAAGPHMAKLMDALPKAVRGGYAETAEALEPIVLGAVKAGDAVIVKGSLGSRMGGIVRSLKVQLPLRAARPE